MNLAELKEIKETLGAKSLKIMCTGELNVDWRLLRDLQILSDGRSLKQTDSEKVLRLAESLLRFGIVNNLQIWLDKDNNHYCFDAHHRKKAFEKLAEIGLDIPLLPATRCLAETKLEAQKLVIIKETRSSWVNVEVVRDYLSEVKIDINIAARTIDIPEFNWIDASIEENNEEKPDPKADEIPEVVKVVIKTGDLIELGNHRVLCGNSTKPEDVGRLMAGEKADMVFTDPPYGINIVKDNQVGGGGIPNDGGYPFGGVESVGKIGGENIRPSKTYKKIKGDENTETANKFYKCCLDLGLKNIILWGGNYFTDFLPPSRCWLIWNKEMTGNFSEAEMAWTSFTKGGVKLFKFLWNGLSREGNRKDELKSRVHPTQKPVGLFVNIFDKFESFKTIYDGFLGSGSTLIAAEKTQRRCFGMEIDAYYVSVIITRYCEYVENYNIVINGKKVDWNEYQQSGASPALPLGS